MPPQRQVLARQARADRRADRLHLGRLSDLVISAATRTRYAAAFLQFEAYVVEAHGYFASDPDFLDDQLAEFIECLWQEGDPRSHAANAYAGTKYFLKILRKHLWGSKSLLDAWGRHELPSRALPFTVETLFAYCGVLIQWRHADCALALLVGFHGIMRSGELMNFTRGHMSFEDNGNILVSLPSTKTSKRTGARELISLTDSTVVRLLRRWADGKSPGDRLVTIPDHSFRNMFNRVSSVLKLDSFNYKLYSVRRGGATHHFKLHGRLDATMLRMRVASQRTCRIYLDDGMAALAYARMSPAQRHDICSCAAICRQWAARFGSA